MTNHLPLTTFGPGIVTSRDAIALLLVEATTPEARRHPSTSGRTADDLRAELVHARLLGLDRRPTLLGRQLLRLLTGPTARLRVQRSTPPSDHEVWVDGSRAAVATLRGADLLEIHVVPRASLWNHLVSWLELGRRPALPGRRAWNVRGSDLEGFVDALRRGEHARAAELSASDASPPGQTALFAALLEGTARSWSLRTTWPAGGTASQLTVVDGGERGWWLASVCGEPGEATLRLDPIDTEDLWRALASALGSLGRPCAPETDRALVRAT